MGKKGKSANKYRKVEISHENIKKENIKAYRGIIFFSLILLTIVIGTSYALFSTVRTSKETVEVEAGTFKISFLDSNYINLENTYPMTDEEGFNTPAYQFTIRNTGTLNAKYNISLEESEDNNLDKSYIKYRIKEGEGEWSDPALLSSGTILSDNRQLNSEQDTSYQLQLWLDESAPNEVQGTKYKAKIVVSATQTNANIVNVAQPIINLNGASAVNIEQNTSFIDPGVSSIQAKEEIAISTVTKRYEYFDGTNTTPVEAVDTTKIGTYYIYYEVLDSNNNKGLAIRIVNVHKPDTTPPTITVVGESSIILDYGAEYTDQGAIAQDDIDGDLTSKIVTVGEINTKKEGTQIIKYLIIDSEGNTASAVRTVYIKRKYKDDAFVLNEYLSNAIRSVYDISIDSVNVPLTYAITSSGETPQDDDYKTIEELETTGFAEEGRLVFKRNGDYVIYIKDSLGTITKKELSVYGLDTTRPTCKWAGMVSIDEDQRKYYDLLGKYFQPNPSAPNYLPDYNPTGVDGYSYIGLGFEKQIHLECTDPVDIDEKYLTDQMLQITNPDVLKITNISAPTKINLGYRYTIILKGLKVGNSKITLPENTIFDKAGNPNEEAVDVVEDRNINDITVAELKVDSTDVVLDLGIEPTKRIEVTGTNLPNKVIFESSNEDIVKVDTDGVLTGVSPGVATITVLDWRSMDRKIINVKVVNTVKLTFTKGEGVESLTSTSLSCTAEDETGCEITLPSFTAMSGYEAIGWNTNEYEGVGTPPGSTIKVSENATYYAIAVPLENKNIKAVYTYNQTVGASDYCVTGEEATCQVNNCIETQSKGSCPVGTIIKYAVNNSEEKVFFVLHDDGRTMTLQQRENTIQSAWYASGNDSTHGPITALDALDTVTSGWTNVRTQKYTMGKTDFLAHSTFAGTPYATVYTKCHSASSIGACSIDGYTMAERTGKARFITIQEARTTGCGHDSDKPNCPIWMYNYLSNSVDNGGTVNDTTTGGSYHTMSTFGSASTHIQHDWYMMSQGWFGQTYVTSSTGIRAVIVINK